MTKSFFASVLKKLEPHKLLPFLLFNLAKVFFFPPSSIFLYERCPNGITWFPVFGLSFTPERELSSKGMDFHSPLLLGHP